MIPRKAFAILLIVVIVFMVAWCPTPVPPEPTTVPFTAVPAITEVPTTQGDTPVPSITKKSPHKKQNKEVKQEVILPTAGSMIPYIPCGAGIVTMVTIFFAVSKRK